MSWQNEEFPELSREALFGDRVVPCFRDRPHHFHDLLDHSAALQPDREALVMGETRLTWAGVKEECDRVARALAARGLRAGDRVLILMNNAPGFVISLFAVARLNAVSVPFSVRASTDEVAHVFEDSGASMILHDGRQSGRIPPSAAPAACALATLDGSAPLPEQPAREEETAFILYTSGTTGRPKGAMLAHVNLIHAAMYYEAAMRMTEKDRIIAAVPLNHVTGIAALISTAARAGACMIVMDAFKTGPFLDLAEAENMTYTLMVPAMYNLCLLQKDFPSRNLNNWRLAAYGGAPMPEPTIRKLAEAVPGLQFANCYGSTETIVAQLITPPPHAYAKREFVGCALPGTTAIVMDEHGREAPPGEPGELWLAGPNVVRGYWRNPEATGKAFQGGYWKSGDIAAANSDGFVKILDRSKDMINRGGLKIYSAELENVLTDHPAVSEAAVIAVPCPVLGERVHAVIALATEAGEEDLARLCRDRLSDYKVPESWTLGHEPLLRNANGKVDKKAIRERLLAESAEKD